MPAPAPLPAPPPAAPKAQRDPFGLGLTIPTPKPVEPPRPITEPAADDVHVDAPAIDLPKFDFGDSAPAPAAKAPASGSNVVVAPNIPDDDVLFEEPNGAPAAVEARSEHVKIPPGAEDSMGGEISVEHEPSSETDFSDVNPVAAAAAPSAPLADGLKSSGRAPSVASPAVAFVPPPARPPSTSAEGALEAQLREALGKASREMIERIAWEVVPQLAESIIRQELDRLVKERQGK